MKIPSSSKIDTRSLARIFDNMSESYKIFWFKGIMRNVRAGRADITFQEIIDQMIVDAWYMVSEFRLNLGPSDTLEKIVRTVHGDSGLKSTDKPESIRDFLRSSDDNGLRDMKKTLTLNVPYRLQAPFFTVPDPKIWNKTQQITEYINGTEGVIYTIESRHGAESVIHINEDWMEYLTENMAILCGWADYNLILYLQRRNPAVPGIASKIYVPQKRQLDAVKKYWKGIIDITPLKDIYSDIQLTSKDISIDHFVPWSYVASDELWNLIPTTKAINSSKSNNLPEWDRYFGKMCRTEYAAYQLSNDSEQIRKLFRKCERENLNNEEIKFRLYKPGQDMTHFSNQLQELLLPIYESARNMGFGKWEYK